MGEWARKRLTIRKIFRIPSQCGILDSPQSDTYNLSQFKSSKCWIIVPEKTCRVDFLRRYSIRFLNNFSISGLKNRFIDWFSADWFIQLSKIALETSKNWFKKSVKELIVVETYAALKYKNESQNQKKYIKISQSRENQFFSNWFFKTDFRSKSVSKNSIESIKIDFKILVRWAYYYTFHCPCSLLA